MDDDEIMEHADSDTQSDFEERQDKIEDIESEMNKIDLDADDEKLEELQKEVDDLEIEQENTKEKAVEEARDNIATDIEEALEDPIQYFVEEQGIYDVEDLLKQPFISINIDEATDDAVATDGWQHFVASYDGDSIDLPSGTVLARIN